MAVCTSKIMDNIDHITEELADIKKSLLVSEVKEEEERSKRAWNRIIEAGRKIDWDNVDAVDEIRMQREKGS